MHGLFYRKYNADAQPIFEYRMPKKYDQACVFELADVYQKCLEPILKNKKNIFSQLNLECSIQIKTSLTLYGETYAVFLHNLNALACIQSDLKTLKLLFGSPTPKYLNDVVNYFIGLPNEYLQLFNPKMCYKQEERHYPFSYLCLNHLVDFIVQLSVENTNILLAGYRHSGQKHYLVIGGQFNDREFDSLIPYLFEHELEDLNIDSIQLQHPEINFLADTYFGEFYTERRKKKGVEDALTRYGYHHSFEKIAHLFPKTSFNILNFEAVFNVVHKSHLAAQKDFILGAQAEKTLNELKNRNFNAVALANNHALDYGSPSFLHTEEQFKKCGMSVLGGGENQYESNRILELNIIGKKVAIFNGYWNKVNAYVDYEFYALADRPGINILNGVLLAQIELYKWQHPDSMIICFCHWGLDFKPVHPYQRLMSKKIIGAGADLILGHGPHTIQDVERINEKTVIYSLGNGVFNSNGEFDSHAVLPYGMITRLDLAQQKLKLYPFLANNLKTFWQPRLVTDQEFLEIKDFYQESSWMIPTQDELGFHFIVHL